MTVTAAALCRGPACLRWAAAFALLYVISLAASAPASVFGWALALWTGQTMTLEGASHSLWRGQALKLHVVDSRGITHSYEGLGWELLASRLFWGELAVRIHITDARLRGTAKIALHQRGVSTSEATFDLPASSLTAVKPELFPPGLAGQLTLRSEGFGLSGGLYHGAASVDWRDAATGLGGVHSLGEYRARIVASGPRLEYRVETVSGALQLEGHGIWSTAEGLTFEGKICATPDHRARLEPLLTVLLGAPNRPIRFFASRCT